MQSTTTSSASRTQHKVMKIVAKRTFCTMATTSPAGYGHAAGVVYVFANNSLWSHTRRTSHKAGNIAANHRVGVCIPFRQLPVGPPYTVHFQAAAELVAMDDPAALALIESGALKAITSHGELDMADGCFVRMQPRGTIHSFGPGAKIIDLMRDPLTAGVRSFVYAPAP